MVTAAYKETEIGKIPKDWRIAEIGKIAKIKTGSKNTEDKVDGGQYPFYVRSDKVERIDVYSYDEEAVLTAGDGVGTGKIFHYVNGKYELHQRCYRIFSFEKTIFPHYFFWYFSSAFYKRIMMMTAKSSVDSVRREMISAMQIPVPEFKEQQAIAEALSDIDHLIASTEKLIAKKKAIKQGLIQELLTGTRRLPGFTKPWKLKKISQCGYLQKELIYPEKTPQKQFWEYSMPAYDLGKKPLWVSGKKINSARIKISDSVLLFNKLNVRQKRVWNVCNCSCNSVCSSEFLPFYSDSINLTLLEEILLSDKVTQDFENVSSGTSNSQKRITPNQFLDYVIFIPQEKEEQDIIAIFFDSLNLEMDSLYQKLDKLLKLKQGMMSELLTGRIRFSNIPKQETAQ